MKPQVNVLISTYNGEKYVKTQMESIFEQTYQNIKIYVRDDGSTDGTIELLKDYQRKGKLVFLQGQNLKWGRSFLTLLAEADEGEYWAFCDQDDYWYPEKISWAVEWMEQQKKGIPLLFHSAYELVNEDMSKVIGTYTPPAYSFDFRRSLTDCLYQGFSIVLNRGLRDYMLRADLMRLSSHDWWACLLVTQFGTSYFDQRFASKHRRLEESMSGGSLKSKLKWFGTTFFEGNEDIHSCAREFERIYGKKCKPKDRVYVRWFCHQTYHFKDAVRKAFYPKRWRAGMVSEVSIRLLMLCGRI